MSEKRIIGGVIGLAAIGGFAFIVAKKLGGIKFPSLGEGLLGSAVEPKPDSFFEEIEMAETNIIEKTEGVVGSDAIDDIAAIAAIEQQEKLRELRDRLTDATIIYEENLRQVDSLENMLVVKQNDLQSEISQMPDFDSSISAIRHRVDVANQDVASSASQLTADKVEYQATFARYQSNVADKEKCSRFDWACNARADNALAETQDWLNYWEARVTSSSAQLSSDEYKRDCLLQDMSETMEAKNSYEVEVIKPIRDEISAISSNINTYRIAFDASMSVLDSLKEEIILMEAEL